MFRVTFTRPSSHEPDFFRTRALFVLHNVRCATLRGTALSSCISHGCRSPVCVREPGRAGGG
jgi:hypothetical protein